MYNNIKKKLNQKGFTLAEMLIVVAIIAVLVAVSIPIFTSKLEKAREATDIANMRAARAAAVTALLSEDSIIDESDIYYDAENGVLAAAKPGRAYGQGTTASGGMNYTGYSSTTKYTDKVIKVNITKPNEGAGTDADVEIVWE
ncbi:MAG: prepilin-type N-terminal cleavage/methylation domain-containing protein [Clostridium sp.]|nr:prepilin-type N-terminal cleavage/methylation domain-containing protein [Clostridium sp.]